MKVILSKKVGSRIVAYFKNYNYQGWVLFWVLIRVGSGVI